MKALDTLSDTCLNYHFLVIAARQAGDLEEVVQNGMGDAVNYHNLIRNQLMEIQTLRQRMEQRERHIRAIQHIARADNQPDPGAGQVQEGQWNIEQEDQLNVNQQVQDGRLDEIIAEQLPVGIQHEANAGDELDSDDGEQASEHENEQDNQDEGNSQHDDDGNINDQNENKQSEEEQEEKGGPSGDIPCSSMHLQQPGFSGKSFGTSPSKIPRPISQKALLDTSDSSNASAVVMDEEDDTDTWASDSTFPIPFESAAAG